MKKVITIIFLTSSECNLECQYCYVTGSRQNIKRFNKSNIKKTIHNCSIGFDSVEFCWHGGEPLLLGKDFYTEVLTAQKEEADSRDVTFQNNIQSNGILLDNLWLDFLEASNIHVGLSLDAPSDTNYIHRNFHYSKLQPLLTELKKRNLPLGLLCVISQLNVARGQEIFEFYKSIGADSFGLLALKNMPQTGRPAMPTNDELFSLYKKVFDLWTFTPNTFSCIEPLDTMLRAVLGQKPRGCSFSSSCLKRMITIDQEGNVVPCGSLVSDEFVLGNILKEPLINILSNQRTQDLRKRRSRHALKNCGECAYISVCRGGCRADAFWFSGSYDGKYPFCEAKKLTFEHIENTIRTVSPNLVKIGEENRLHP